MSGLVIAGLHKSFGALRVIEDFSLTLAPGARHAVIGPNGAGKTTLFNLVTGWLRPSAGTIRLGAVSLAGRSPADIAGLGLARSFQRNTLFEGLTVAENLRLACQAFDPSRRSPFRHRLAFDAVTGRARRLAGHMKLDGILDRPVNALSYGERRQLEVALAMSSEPSVLLLDEPAAGTSPAERRTLIELIRALPPDVALLMVEHDMDVVFDVCDAITVMNYGRILATGTPDEVRADAAVREAYLGTSHA